MQQAGSSRSWLVLGAGLAILVGVAAAGRWLTRTSVSNAAVASGTSRVVADGVRLVFVAILLVGSVCLVLALAGGSLMGPPPVGGRRRRLGVRWVVTLLLVLAVVLLGIWFLGQRGRPPLATPLHRPDTRAAPSVGGSGSARTWDGDWPGVFVALAVAALVVAAWADARRRQARPRAGGTTLARTGPEEMEVPDADLDPEAEPDPRRAVVVAYHRLLSLLARRGWGRWRSEAPLEHLDRVLVGHAAGMGPARSLVAAFERAEYSDHPVTPAERDHALAWLRAVVADLDLMVTD